MAKKRRKQKKVVVDAETSQVNYITADGAEVEDPRTHFRSPFELVPFIEGFAHLEDWDRSMVLTAEILRISSTYNLVTCALWQRINHNTTASEGKTRALAWMTSRTGCPF